MMIRIPRRPPRFRAVTGGTDYCELSVIVDYMGENQRCTGIL